MTTRLDSQLKREIVINGTAYTLTIAPDRFALVLKGRRKGLEIRWTDLVSGEVALATALNASLTANMAPADKKAPAAAKPKPHPRSKQTSRRRKTSTGGGRPN